MTQPTDLLKLSAQIEGEWLHEKPASLPTVANEPYKVIGAALAKARQQVNSARSTVEKLRADYMIPEAGRSRKIRETIEEARKTVGDEVARADRAVAVMRAVLNAEALPKLVPGNELIARADAQMILDRADDPQTAMAALARRSDDVGALVASPWGRDYLAARGFDDPAFHQQVVLTSVDAATESGDGNRRAAALHAQRVTLLEQARDALATGATIAFTDLEKPSAPLLPQGGTLHAELVNQARGTLAELGNPGGPAAA
jgi:hypothetical protein